MRRCGLQVALRYSQSSTPLILKVRSKGFHDRGADISFLSVFPDEAEILFTGDHIRDFGALAEAGGADGLPLLNQFPHESVLIAKNLLAEAAQGKYGTRMPWLAHTYTLPHELPAFVCEQWPSSSSSFSTPHDVSDHAESEKNGNTAMASAATTFIIKPWNMSRSRGVLITRERRAILTTCNEAFGPRLACSYIERPLLLENRKFDCRMYVAVTSLSPPVCHLYSKFYARVSANNFAHAPLSDHLAHLTVLKYEGVPQDVEGALVVKEDGTFKTVLV